MGRRKGALEEMVNPWQGRRVFVTGHTGFKGGWLALWLARRGAIVRGFALEPPTEPNFFTAASIANDVEDIRGDIRDFSRLEAAIQDFAPEIIFHLAAQSLVRTSYSDPLLTYSTNVMGTANVLEAARHSPSVRAVICVTTDKVYRDQDWEWPYRESDPVGGYDPYASSKACAELVAAAYRASFFSPRQLAIATTRAGNVIGGGDWSCDRLIPDLIRGFESAQPVLIRNPMAIRPWQHVLDPLQGYILLAERMLAGESRFASAFNFGPIEGDIWPVERIATRLVDQWGKGASWVQDSSSNPHESRSLRLDSSRARIELGWTPRLTTEAALDWTLEWYRVCADGGNMRDKTLAQIEAYEKLGR